MAGPVNHLRWRLTVPEALEEVLDGRLEAAGATAMYRDADPPRAYFAYFPPGACPSPSLIDGLDGVRLEAAEAFADEDWLAKSREGFGRFPVGQRFFVRPVWDRDPAPAGRIPITVNPGLAFGTGGHETTRLCMELLEALAGPAGNHPAGPVLDVGSGTGILALAAHHLGFAPILAFDLDPDCGPAMAELVEMNADTLGGALPFAGFVGTLDDPRIQAAAPYHGLLANILLETIQELLPGLARLAAPGAWLIASGLLAEREDEALVSLAAGGFQPCQVRREGQWIAVRCERRP